MSDHDSKRSLFWISYSDLMTSLFFTMLVLFVVIIIAMGQAKMKTEQANNKLSEALKKANVTIEQQKQLLKLNEQFQTLTSSSSLGYDENKRMFYVKDFVGVEIFEPDKDVIKPEYMQMVDTVGKEIKRIVDSLNRDGNNFKFQLVIEGTAAIPFKELVSKTYNPDNNMMYMLSYKRALSLYNRWKHLNFRESNTEIIIAGSGFNGINRDMDREENNKRFVIQIIPKIDKPKG